MTDRKKASKKDAEKRVKVTDLKPKKDVKGGYKPQKPDGSL